MNAEIIAIECNRRQPDLWNVWTLERVQAAFSLGHGTPADFQKFAGNNALYAHFITNPAEIAEFLAKHREEVTA